MYKTAILLPLAVIGCLAAPRDFEFTKIDLKLLEEASEVDRQLEKKGLIYEDPGLSPYLDGIAARLLAGHPAPDRVKYRIRALRDPMVNAFALPNGSIYVMTGMLALLENEAQLASVVGHEITHVSERHAYLQNRRNRNLSFTVNVIEMATMFNPGGSFGTAVWAVRQASPVVAVLMSAGYSREMESDADRSGLDLIAVAGYEPHAMPRTFELADEKLEFEPAPNLYRSHPKLEARAKYTKAWADGKTASNPGGTSENDYLARMASVVFFNAGADLDSRRARTAAARAKRLVSWNPTDLRHSVLLADAYRSLGAKTAEPTANEKTGFGKMDVRTRAILRTAEEEQAELLKLAGGADARRTNLAQAEKLYLDAIAREPGLPDAHRGLAMLYQDLSRTADAIREYRRYLELAPRDALDRRRIERRIEEASK